MQSYDVVVVGAGVMGSAAAYHLARRGRRVLLLEQFEIGHSYGSSHGHSRIIRLAYDAPVYVRLAQAAYPLWRALEAEAGTKLLLTTGGLDIAIPGTPSFEATRASMAEVGAVFDELDHAAIEQRFPQFQLPDEAVGIFQPDAGILNASHCVATLIAQARHHGATIQANEAAIRLAPDGGGLEIHSATARYRAERLIVTAGSWARSLLHQLGLDLPLAITKEQIAFFAPPDPAPFQPGRFPIFIQHQIGHWAGYGFPIFGLPGVKVAFHGGGPPIEPEHVDDGVVPQRLDELRAYLGRILPQAVGPLILAQTCRYTSTPDEHFIIDRHPEHPQIVIGSPCSGHGFKFGVLIGAILADLAEDGMTNQPIDMFTLRRFMVY